MYENHNQDDRLDAPVGRHDDSLTQQEAPQPEQQPPAAENAQADSAPAAQPALPPNATRADLERWLKELTAQELAEKRKEQAKQRAKARQRRREGVRLPRTRAIELLYAYYVVPPIEGDDDETERLALLFGKLALDQRAVAKPAYAMVEPVKLDLHVPKIKEPETAPDAV